MKNIYPVLRIIGFVLLSFLIAEWVIETDSGLAIVAYPMVWIVLAVVLTLSIAIEVCVRALQNILFRSLKSEAQSRYVAMEAAREKQQRDWFKKMYQKLVRVKPIEQEEEIVLDHNYDGIRELDNDLPPWWLYGFYASIVFALFYFLKYEAFNGNSQIEEYEIEVAQAKIDLEDYKRTHKDEIDANTVELLTEAGDVKSGETIFTANCIACHKAGGSGGIGPNLTDDYWILGGGIKNVFNTITEGGRSGKGMISWKTDLKPSEIQQVASYVLSLHGTNPVNAKEPEGELWTNPDARIEDAEVEVDSAEVKMILKNAPVTNGTQ